MCAEYPPHLCVSEDNIMHEYYLRKALSAKPTPLLVKLHGIISFGEDAQRFIISDKFSEITVAVAILGDPEYGYYESSNTQISIFRVLNSPTFPIEFFKDEDRAVNWLLKFL